MKESWQRWRFDQIAENVMDRVEPSEANVAFYVGLEHLDSESLKIRRWGKPADVESTKLLFKAGDIIFGKRRVYQRKLAVADFAGICSAHAMVLRPRADVILPEFLPFFMQSDLFMERALAISVGSLSPTINWRTLAQQAFALPLLDEQRRIGRVHSALDRQINDLSTMLQSAINLKHAIRKSAFDPDKYRVCRLSSLCEERSGIKIGPFGAQLHQSDYIDVGIPVIMPTNMIDETVSLADISQIPAEKADELSIHKVKENDILLPRRGELDRRAYITKNEEGWLCGTGSIRIRLREDILPKAVFHSIASSHVLRWLVGNAVGTTMPNLNSKIVSRIPIALPSLNEQKEAIETIDKIQIEIRRIDERLAQAKQMKNIIFCEALGESNV